MAEEAWFSQSWATGAGQGPVGLLDKLFMDIDGNFWIWRISLEQQRTRCEGPRVTPVDSLCHRGFSCREINF